MLIGFAAFSAVQKRGVSRGFVEVQRHRVFIFEIGSGFFLKIMVM